MEYELYFRTASILYLLYRRTRILRYGTQLPKRNGGKNWREWKWIKIVTRWNLRQRDAVLIPFCILFIIISVYVCPGESRVELSKLNRSVIYLRIYKQTQSQSWCENVINIYEARSNERKYVLRYFFPYQIYST